MTRIRVLSIAGCDPSGGAGLLADVVTFEAFGCHGMAVVAGLTAQNSTGVRSTSSAPEGFVGRQIEAVLDDGLPAAAKTGMLATAESVRELVSAFARRPEIPLVVDPVMASSGGVRLAEAGAESEIVRHLVPLAAVVTPNATEAASMSGLDVIDVHGAVAAARRMVELGARAVLVKGGHLPGPVVVDVLVERGEAPRLFRRDRIARDRAVRGTGCALSAALAACLGRGLPLQEAVSVAGDWTHAAILRAYVTGPGALCLDRSVRVRGMPS